VSLTPAWSTLGRAALERLPPPALASRRTPSRADQTWRPRKREFLSQLARRDRPVQEAVPPSDADEIPLCFWFPRTRRVNKQGTRPRRQAPNCNHKRMVFGARGQARHLGVSSLGLGVGQSSNELRQRLKDRPCKDQPASSSELANHHSAALNGKGTDQTGGNRSRAATA
jgi:hypothetical protein